MTDEPHDPLPGLLADLDQAREAAPLLAGYAWTLFRAFVAEGFTEAQALMLTANQIKVESSE